MPYQPQRAAAYLADRIPEVRDYGYKGKILGCPSRELARSPAASRVAELAGEVGLGLFHTEWRHHLALPEDWVPEHDPTLADPPTWMGGVLPERKYQSFRHDQAIGGFHPGMRAKWSTHELCHGLVGFAWKPGQSRLFTATAARLAELIPVVLWYFLDEAHLKRCPIHQGGNALYSEYCGDCERIAGPALDELHAEARLEEGRLFIEREMAAIQQTVRMGHPVPHIHGGLNLCSDGLAYAAAHGPRLDSEAFHHYAERFMVEDGGFSSSLEGLTERAMNVALAIAEGRSLAPIAPSPEQGRVRWVVQDLAWRILSIAHQCTEDAQAELLKLVDGLVPMVEWTVGAPSVVMAQEPGSLFDDLYRQYCLLEQDFVLPPAAEVWALGHRLGRATPDRSQSQVAAGVCDALPLSTALFGVRIDEAVAEFLSHDLPSRVPLGRRFATWAAGKAPPEVASLLRYEAALAHLPPTDPLVVTLDAPEPGVDVRLATGVAVLIDEIDVLEFARNVDFGDIIWGSDQVVDVDGEEIPHEPTAIILVRHVSGEPMILDVEPAIASNLLELWDGGRLDVQESVWNALVAHGVIRRARFPI